MTEASKLSAEAVRRWCDPASFDFETTDSLPLLTEVLGQPRAVAALEFGASMASPGFNLFALGQPGSGKTTLIREYLEMRASAQAVPPDLCYVNNFGDPRRPAALRLPPGMGVKLKADIAALVDELITAIPRAFDAKEYTRQRDKVLRELEERRREEFARIEQHVSESGMHLMKAPGGLMLVPSVNGKPLGDAELEALTAEQREQLFETRVRLERELEERLRAIREIEKGTRDAIRALDTETAGFAARHVMDDLRESYKDQEGVVRYLASLQADIVEHVEDFRKGKDSEPPQQTSPPAPVPVPNDSPFTRYQVNVLVDNGALKGAPVLVESNPTYHNLTGRMEHQSTWGGTVTDFTMIKPGALHRANGGYLVIPARECLLNPFAWEGLKRSLKDRALRVEELGTQLSMISTVTLDPEPVPLDVKVVLIGSPHLYYRLYGYDEDFQKLFKVKADFATQMDRTPESERAYALFVHTITRQENYRPFDRGAVARVVEYGSRAADDQEKLSTRFGEVADLIREAAHRAGQNGHPVVTAADVRAAEEARRYRQSLIEERMRESILKGAVLLDTTATAVGRINGLSVMSQGDFAFGHPARLTATVAPGRRGIVSIEREVELSGPIHGKGVLILSGYLLRKYAQTGPLSLSASLVFEQSYGMVEGDSASLAELCVLLSAISEAPLRQDLAITGSVNQHGQVQPVGGVTEKIEGFFDVCKERGLTGTQGVVIPASNRRQIMLRDEIVDAVGSGQFHIWVVEAVDDALRLLTGLEPGETSAPGEYPEGTLHGAVARRLQEYAEALKAIGAEEKKT
ncbi:MAG: Lon protease family protein [Bryobacteraceae bacterium]